MLDYFGTSENPPPSIKIGQRTDALGNLSSDTIQSFIGAVMKAKAIELEEESSSETTRDASH